MNRPAEAAGRTKWLSRVALTALQLWAGGALAVAASVVGLCEPRLSLPFAALLVAGAALRVRACLPPRLLRSSKSTPADLTLLGTDVLAAAAAFFCGFVQPSWMYTSGGSSVLRGLVFSACVGSSSVRLAPVVQAASVAASSLLQARLRRGEGDEPAVPHTDAALAATSAGPSAAFSFPSSSSSSSDSADSEMRAGLVGGAAAQPDDAGADADTSLAQGSGSSGSSSVRARGRVRARSPSAHTAAGGSGSGAIAAASGGSRPPALTADAWSDAGGLLPLVFGASSGMLLSLTAVGEGTSSFPTAAWIAREFVVRILPILALGWAGAAPSFAVSWRGRRIADEGARLAKGSRRGQGGV
jgi:hypothetical protein